MPKKKQTKAEKDFIAKIGTIGISFGATSSNKNPTCADCGEELQPIGTLEGTFHGQEIVGDVYTHGIVPFGLLRRRRNRRAKKHDDSGEQSLSE